jgi:hypothetical protein
MSSEKFCLKWNDFERNISSAFRDIREEKEFFDITLACEDDQLQAHRVILSACSPFFKTVLRRNPHQHPLLYLKGVSLRDMQVRVGQSNTKARRPSGPSAFHAKAIFLDLVPCWIGSRSLFLA